MLKKQSEVPITMLFSKKEKDNEMPVPSEKISEMSRQGLSDKDIIRELKKEGYTYKAIEKGMLGAVKGEVSKPEERKIAPSFQQNRPVPQSNPQPTPQPQMSGIERAYAEEPSPSDFIDEPEDDFLEGELPEQEFSPDMIIEEIVEGVVDEKWTKFDKSIEKMEDRIHDLKAKIENMPEKESKNENNDEILAKIDDFEKKMDDVQARVGGLEKAFKQFLPSLTQNVQRLSKMIDEMKKENKISDE